MNGLLWFLASLVLAQELPAPDDPPPEGPTEQEPTGDTPSLDALADAGAAQAVLEAASALIDVDSDTPTQVAAIERLGALGDPRAVPFIEAATIRGSEDVQLAALAVAPNFSDQPRMHRVVRRLANARREAVAIAAIKTVDEAKVPDSFEVLWRLVNTERQEASVRSQSSRSRAIQDAARAQLMAEHADEVAARGGLPAAETPINRASTTLMAISGGTAGATLLASVGQLGQTDAGPAIGGIGGALIGGSSGVVYAINQDLSLANSLQFTTGVGWGGAAGLAAANALDVEQPLYLTTAGTTAGAVGALLRFKAKPSAEDILESNGLTLLGQQTAAGLARWGGANDTERIWIGMGGGALGALFAQSVRSQLSLDSDDAALATAGGVTGLWLSLLIPPAFDAEVNGGAVQTAIPLGIIAGGAISQATNVPARSTDITGYGFVSGNILGVGIPLLFVADDNLDGSPQATGALIGGVGSAALAAGLSPNLSFDTGDPLLIAAGTGLVTAEISAISYVLSERTNFNRSDGLIVTGLGASALGWGLATQNIDVKPGAPLLVTTAAGWGIFYGGLAPIALGLEGDPDDLVLAITLVGDAFIAGAILAQTPSIGLKPQQTVLPQLGGLSGAVVGTLAPALFTDEVQTITAGSLIGSFVGGGVGIILEKRYGEKWIPRMHFRRPHLRLPGEWSVNATPLWTPGEDTPGLMVHARAVGW